MQLLYVACNVCGVNCQLFKEQKAGICALNFPASYSIGAFSVFFFNVIIWEYYHTRFAISSGRDILKTKPAQDNILQ